MTLGYMKKVVRQSWEALPMPDTVIAQVSALGQGQIIDIDFFDQKQQPIQDINITGLYDGDPPIESIKPETDINPVSADAEKLSELVECQDIPTIEQEQDMGIAKEYGTIETEEKIIDLSAPSLAEG